MLYHIYSGHLFFSANATLVLVATLVLAGVVDRPRLAASVARIVALSAIALAALSGTPVTLWLTIPALALAVAFVLFGIGSAHPRPALAVLTIVASLAVVCLELRWHVGTPSLERPARVIVLGDSLSSGGFGERTTWPSLMGTAVNCEVVNLSRPGDTSSSTLDGQVPDVPPFRPGDLVIVEIGGNDMLDGIGVEEFERNLDEMLGAVTAEDRVVVIVEFPLLPGRWAYGAAQRRLGIVYGTSLIPKRVLAGVLLDPENTYDGLHLTQQGHDDLARAIVEWADW